MRKKNDDINYQNEVFENEDVSKDCEYLYEFTSINICKMGICCSKYEWGDTSEYYNIKNKRYQSKFNRY
ncbi:hypothetical protein PIROE2DRAFT_11281 [Piromyces sp. E2]|nr:hypothetical protein PIROE2DRAFT_11281 [Piromyces sp. E2]|eukprot:OUM62432.1 hypothetical protein PIROE2DRAFT_11281 [Piromyces sp. E2]